MNYWRFNSTQFYVPIRLFIFLFTFGSNKFAYYNIVFLFFVCIVSPYLLFGILISTFISVFHIKFLLNYLILFFLVVLEYWAAFHHLCSQTLPTRLFHLHPNAVIPPSILSCICTCYLTQYKEPSSCQHMLLTMPLNLVLTHICHDKIKRWSVRL